MNIIQLFQRSNFVQFRISSMLYVQTIPRSYFILKFQSMRKKLCYQFYLAQNKTPEIMEKVYKVGPKNLRKNFRFKNFLGTKLVPVNSRCRKSLIMSTLKPDNFMQLF